MRKKLLALTAIVLSMFLAACGSSLNSINYKADTAIAPASDGFYEESYSLYNDSAPNSETIDMSDASRKLIKTYSIDVETESFDTIMPAIESRISELGGYIEQLNTYYGERYSSWNSRHSSLTVRIPKGKEDEFINFIGSSSNITRQSLDVSDVTLSYVDVESHRDAYIVERDRLLVLLESAESIDDIISIESRLSEVRYYLESMESQLRTMDNLIDYSTINLSVSEVKQYTEPEPETYGQRISTSFHDGIESFTEGIKDFSIWFVGAFPTLLFFGIIIFIILVIRKKIKARKKANQSGKKDKKVTESQDSEKVNEAVSSENKQEGN